MSLCPLDRAVVNPDQIRTILRTFKERLPELFPDRVEARACAIAAVPEGSNPGDDARAKARGELVGAAAAVLTGPLIELIEEVNRELVA